MQIHFRNFIFLLPLFFVTTQCAYADNYLTQQVGDANISIPIPTGFVDGGKELNNYYSNVFSESDSRFLAVFTPTKDSQSGMQYLVGTYRDSENKHVTEKSFSKVRDYLHSNLVDVIDLANAKESDYQAQVEKARKLFNEESKSNSMEYQSVGKQEPIGIIIDSQNAIGWLTILRSGNDEKDIPQAGATVIALVKGKILNLNVYRSLHSTSDLVPVRKDCVAWLKKINKSN